MKNVDLNYQVMKVSQPISRVLSRAIIHLWPTSPQTFSSLPESNASNIIRFLFSLTPSGVYLATSCYQLRGALLPHHFTLTLRHLKSGLGGIFAVALAVSSHSPGVTWHPALRSPDFPPLIFLMRKSRIIQQAAIAQLTRLPGYRNIWL